MLWTSWLFVGIYILMLLLSFYNYKKINNSKNYISTDKKISNNTAVISTQMTAASIPAFLILPRLAISDGGLIKGIILALAIIVGSTASYLLIAKRMRVYSEITGDNHTVSSYISARFKSSNGVLRTISASIITVFMVLLSAFTLSVTANVAAQIFGWNKISSAILICGASMIYLYLGGIPASISSDKVRSLIVLGTALAMFGFILFELIVGNTDSSSVRMIPQAIQEQTVSVSNVFSCIGISLGFLGFPTAIKRYLIIKDRKPAKRFSFSAVIWCLVCCAAVLLLVYIVKPESVTDFLNKFFNGVESGQEITIFNAVLNSLLIVSFMITLMAITDGAILAAAITFSSDILNAALSHEKDSKKTLLANKTTVIVIGIASFILALGEEPLPIMDPSFIWATMGACFGPPVLFSLYCRRLTVKGAVSSMLFGLLTILIWKFVLAPLGGIFLLYEIIPGFIVSTAALYAVSYLDRQKPSPRILNEFGRMTEIIKMQGK